jgi:hypothetical protein
MKSAILATIDSLTKREGLLLVCLVAQLLVYWILVFILPAANELVVYQRY